MHTNNPRIIVKLAKVTTPNGEQVTRSVIVYKAKFQVNYPNSTIINEVLPKVDKEYRMLLEKTLNNGIEKLTQNLDNFFNEISRYVVVGDLIEVLSYDLGLGREFIEKSVLNTNWLRQLLGVIKKEYRRVKKEDFVKYAEAVRQLVELFGSRKTLLIFKKEGIKMKKSTLSALCKVASETPRIKELIREKKLPASIIFELPSVDEDEREKIAEDLVGKSFAEAKKYLRKIKNKHI